MLTTPTVSLARWYRGKKRRLGEQEMGQPSLDPRSILTSLLRTDPEAAAHLAAETEGYQYQLRTRTRKKAFSQRSAATDSRNEDGGKDDDEGDDDIGDLQVTTALFIEASGGSLEEACRLMAEAVNTREERVGGGKQAVPGQWRAERARMDRLLEAERVRTLALTSSSSTSSTSVFSSSFLGNTTDSSPSLNLPLPPRPISREDGSVLSYSDFLKKYAVPGIPCIITGGALIVTTADGSGGSDYVSADGKEGRSSSSINSNNPWSSFESLAEALHGCSSSDTRLKVFNQGSACWARLEDAPLESSSSASSSSSSSSSAGGGRVDVSAFIRRVGSGEEAAAASQEGSDGGVRYLHDWSLPLHAPDLANRLTIPKWFANDLFKLVPSSSSPSPSYPSSARTATAIAAATATPTTTAAPTFRYSHSWPSLFVGPRGSKSDLHVDAVGTHFWQAVVHGTKFWRIFPRDHAPFLYPIQTEGSRDVIFSADALNPTTETMRRLGDGGDDDGGGSGHGCGAFAHAWEEVVEEGDLVFVPSACPHFVQNLSDTIAISANFADPHSNANQVLEALEEEEWLDPCGAGAARKALAEALRVFREKEGKGSAGKGDGGEESTREVDDEEHEGGDIRKRPKRAKEEEKPVESESGSESGFVVSAREGDENFEIKEKSHAPYSEVNS